MFSVKLIQSGLNDLKRITRADYCLIGSDQNIIADTFSDFEISQTVLDFFDNEAMSQDVKGFNYLKITDRDQEKYVLVTYAASGDGYMLSRIAASEISHIMQVDTEKEDKDQFYKDIFAGQILYNDILLRAKKLRLNTETGRLVFIMNVDEDYADITREMLVNIFSENREDYVTISDGRIILVKGIDTDEYQEYAKEMAEQILSMINTELMVSATVAYGNVSRGLRELYDSYRQAIVTMEINNIFFEGRSISYYGYLGIGRIIYGLTDEMCKMFLDEVYGEKKEKCPDKAEMDIANSFFENNLSIADTSRELGVPRSTLVYKLDRIQKKCGLNIRCFDDAITFKVAMMVLKLFETKKQ